MTPLELGAFIKAIDGYDGDEIDLEFDLSSYNDHYNEIGEYLIRAIAYDSSDNCQIGYFYLDVVDEKVPVISGPDELDLPAGYSVSNNDILAKYTSSDEYDGSLNVLFLEECEFNYMSLNSSKAVLTSRDRSNNETRKEITINFIDTLPPLIESLDEIHLGYSSRLNITEVINEYVSLSDNFDPNPKINILYDNYSEKIGLIGSFKVGIESIDESGNKSSKEINIVVEDKFPPIVYMDNYVLVSLDYIKLNQEDITDMLIEMGELNKKEKYDMIVLLDTYTGHENEKGSYVYEVKYLSNKGEEIDKTFLINVSYDMYTIDPTIKLQNGRLKTVGIVVIVLGSVTILSTIIFLSIYSKKRKQKAS